MAEPSVNLMDEYDELEGALSGEGEIPGDPITGEIGESDGEGEETETEENGEGESEESGEGKGEDGEATGEGEKEKDEVATEKEDDPNEALKRENAELKATLRDMKIKQASDSAKLERISKSVDSETEFDEETGEEKPKTVDLSPIEKVQAEIVSISERRGEAFADMLEVMTMNPKYEDVESVCTRDRFNDIFEAAARGKVAEEGGDLVTTQLELEAEVWKMRNPYRYMYGVIKEHHPDFAKEADSDKKGESSKVKGETPSEEAKERGKKIAETPVDAATLGRGGGKAMGEWTAEKIDSLGEDELSKVPRDVYDAYLRGDLDE